MKKFIHPVRDEIKIKPVRIDDLVPPDHEVRGVWEFTGMMDLSEADAYYKTEEGKAGRPAIHPRLLLAIWLWGFAVGIITSRALAESCLIRSDFLWLCGGIHVCYKTLSDFRSSHPELLSSLFTKGLVLLDEAGLIDLEKIFIDGTKVDANASLKNFRRHDTLEKRLAVARQWLDSLESMGDTEKEELSRGQLSSRLRHAKEKVERGEQALQKWEERVQERKKAKLDVEETRVSLTDVDANRMKHNDGGFRMSYNCQMAVTKGPRPVITAVDVGDTSADTNRLLPMVEQTEERLGRPPDEAVADNGYLSLKNIQEMVLREIGFYSPDKGREAHTDNSFHIDKFKLNDDETEARCPLGEKLNFVGKTSEEGRRYQRYQREDCRDCPFKQECCPKAAKGRSIKKLVREQRELLDGHNEKMASEKAKELLQLRKETVELVNALLKLRHGLSQLWLRGKEKVRGWLELLGLSFNTLTWIRTLWKQQAER